MPVGGLSDFVYQSAATWKSANQLATRVDAIFKVDGTYRFVGFVPRQGVETFHVHTYTQATAQTDSEHPLLERLYYNNNSFCFSLVT
jgi:hypothetical protein